LNLDRLLCCVVACLIAAVAVTARAQSSLPVLAASASQIRIDGEIGEWRGARFTRLGEGPSGSAEVALAYDASGLYLGARVKDDAFVRTSKPSRDEDALVLRLAFPARGSFAESEAWLFAGRVGETAASAQLRSGSSLSAAPGAKIVEGPNPGGYALEAFLPWACFPGGTDWQYARGAVRLHDVDGRGAARDATSAPATLAAAKLPWLSLDGGPVNAVSNLLRAKNLEASASKLDFVGDVRGDARVERVIVVGPYVVVSGADQDFTFAELPVRSAADVREAELRDLTGDGKPELAIRLRQQNELGARELFKVYGLAQATPAPLFGVELRKETNAGVAMANLKYERASRGPTQLVVTTGSVQGLSSDNYRETPAAEDVAIPLPWGPWRERAYGWNGRQFAVVRERPNDQARTAEAPAPQTARTTEPPRGETPALTVDGTPLDAYKRARGVAPNVKPRFAQSANVLGDARPETLGVFGSDLAITGDSLADRGGFFFIGLPVAQPDDVLGVQTGDLTGDGRRELLVRIRQRIGDVQRELVYCYSVAAQSAQQLLIVEVSRARGGQRIDNKLALVPDKQRSVLTIEPGEARGWSASDYPFVADSADGVAPLLLPWKDHTTQYVFERDRLIPKVRTQ
jgi:hypothetical protein